MEIRIVGSIGDHNELDTIKKLTEIFIIERRIKDITILHKSQK